jgi:hypothetical protein
VANVSTESRSASDSGAKMAVPRSHLASVYCRSVVSWVSGVGTAITHFALDRPSHHDGRRIESEAIFRYGIACLYTCCALVLTPYLLQLWAARVSGFLSSFVI